MGFQHKSLSEQGIYNMSVLREDDKYFYVEIQALKPGVNRNHWDFTLEGIQNNGKSFVGTPLLIAYKGGKIGDGHNYDMTLNPKTGELEADFRDGNAERIVGEITDYKMEERLGEQWLVLSARIWKYYAQQLVNYLVDAKVMAVSVEVAVEDGFEVREDGVEVFVNWDGLGVTILGQGVTPAVEGARLRALAVSDEYKQMRLIAASYVPKTNSNKGGIAKMTEAMKKVLSTALAEYGTVIGFSVDGKYASVLRNNGIPAFYPLADYNESDGVINSKFVDATFVLSAEIAGEDDKVDTVTCNAGNIINQISAQAKADAETAKAEADKAKSECEAAKAECAKATARVEELEKAENERHLREMTSAFDEAVNAYNLTAAAAEIISDEEINVVHNAINEGKYADKETVVGEFKKLAYDKHIATTKKVEKTLAWNFGGDGHTPTGEEAVMASFINSGRN